jgi:hypothetical protein
MGGAIAMILAIFIAKMHAAFHFTYGEEILLVIFNDEEE